MPTTITRPSFIHGSQEDVDALVWAVETVINKCTHDIKCVEVGTYVGGSAVVIGSLLTGKGRLYCIDERKQPSLVTNLESYRVTETVEFIHNSSVKASKGFEDESLDFIYIDADHHYSGVYSDVKHWWPKMKSGAMVCGHDCQVLYRDLSDAQRDKIVSSKGTFKVPYDHLLPDLAFECKWWDFPNIHPGIILAVWDMFGEAANLVKLGSSIWYIVKERPFVVIP